MDKTIIESLYGAYITYYVVIGKEHNEEEFKQEIGAMALANDFKEIIDDTKPEDAWGFRNSDSTVVYGYGPVTDKDSTPIVMSAQIIDDKKELINEPGNLYETVKSILKLKALKGATVKSHNLEISLYYNPNGANSDLEMSNIELSKIARSLLPERTRTDNSTYETFGLKYEYKIENYVKSYDYSYSKNQKRNLSTISLDLGFSFDSSQYVIADTIKNFKSIDVPVEIASEVRYLEQQAEKAKSS